jgi:long-chain fatty acid transport protein
MTSLPSTSSTLQRALLCSLAGAALTPAHLAALGIRNPGQDPFAMSRGNAFVATANNPSAIHYNPAGITQLSGHQLSLGANFVTVDDTFTSAASGLKYDNESEVHALPQVYYTFTPRDLPFSFGLGVYSPFGLGMEWPDDVEFRQLTLKGELKYVTANPVVAWKINDQFSLGAGLMVNYGDATLTRGILAPGGSPGNRIKFEGDDTSLGFNVGLRWQLNQRHAFGIAYRAEHKLDFDGTASANFPAPASQGASAEFQFPQIVTAGYSFRPTPRWNLEVNVDWTDWDSLDTVEFQFENSPTQTDPYHWKSSFMIMTGASYTFDGNWTVSGGYTFSENSVPAEYFKPGIPDSDRHIFNVGVTKLFDRLSLAAALQYAYGPSRTINNAGAPALLANGDYEYHSVALNLAAGYRF